jgi:diguanylate cyclase (GGDEF)-like protein/PAS domain S-box-containing protein
VHTRDPRETKAEVVRLRGMLLADGVRRAAVSLAEQAGLEGPRTVKLQPSSRPSFEGLIEKRLSQLDGRYRALIEASPDALLVLTAAGDIATLNAAGERQFGVAADQVVGEQVSALIPEGLVDRLGGAGRMDPSRAAELSGIALDAKGRRRDGSSFEVELLVGVAASDDEQLLLITCRDVTHRKAAERRLLRREGRFRGLLEAAPNAMLVVNRRGKIMLMNAKAEDWLGYAREDLQTQNLAIIAPATMVDRVTGDGQPGAADRLADEGKPFCVTLRRKDGTALDVEAVMSLSQQADGSLVTIALRDRTEDRRAAAEAEASIAQLSAWIEVSPDPLIVVDRLGCIVAINGEAEHKFGYRSEELQGHAITDLVPEGLVDRLGDDPLVAAEDTLARQMGVGLELHALARNGDAFPVEVMLSRPTAVGHVVITMRDITIRRQMEAELIAGLAADGEASTATLPGAMAELRRQAVERRNMEDALFVEHERASATLNAISDAVCCVDRNARITYLNRIAEDMTGWTSAEARGRPVADVLVLIDHETRQPLLPSVVEASAAADRPARREALVVRRDGFELPVEETLAPLQDRGGQADGAVIVFRDTRAARSLAQDMAHSARHDVLTGLPNRVLFNDRVNQAIAQAPRRSKKVALLFIDLDGFKHVNDSLGHAVGDKLLQSMAKRLVACVRVADTVCRLGGDEFVILLSEVDRADDVAQLAGRVLRAVADAHMVDDHEIRLGASIGISVYPDDGGNAEMLIHDADMAMYQAKESGRHCYRFFTPQMNERAAERQAIETRLRAALEQQEFCLHYQPKVNLRTGEIVGAEALLRWLPTVNDPVSPSIFMPVAEASGLIRPIGAWVLREACQQTRRWLDAGLVLPRIAINISAFEFRDDKFLESVFSALEEAHLPGAQLELELTESALMKNGEVAGYILESLRDRGVRLAVDDFGTGYSSLSNLRKYPIETLKIDKSFIHMVNSGGEEAEVVAAALNMARSLKLRCVAEGVETAEELAFLQAHHCELAQGHYFSRPLPARQFARLLQTGLLDSMAARRQGVARA